ncbi:MULTISPECIES: phage tail tape measure protein [Clostridia]|uniref:phage tail tape measure protein n=1 Tax=Clostridia TaxID=186801 RepID=UPI00189882DB|nr:MULTISPECIES: phage tail tape measure protein [Clostridia]MCB6579529.1 phage tail tape measure protein [Blautia faecis]MCB7291497.1 phage tail tape measure protein [Blautia faecis]
MSDFVMQIGADLDLSKVQEQLDSIKKQKVTLDVEIKGNDDAHNLAKSIEKGLKSTKIDTSGLSKQLADAFNITDKSAIGKIKSQINSVMSELGKTWNGKEFNLQGGKGNAFVSGLSDLANSVSQNANIIQGKMGIYDQFYSYFKDKKIYVSDDLKKALSGDEYKELLNNNIGHIVREASKGVSIDSIWGEMTSMFPEHFADNITNQADQIKRAFEVLAQARQDMTQVISAENMTPEQAAGIKADAFDEVISMANQMRERLQQNIETASEGVKNTYDLDVDINTEKIVSDIRNAIQSATSGAEDAVQINVKINDEELLSQMRSAISQLATWDEPVQVDIQVNKQSLEADLEVALKDVELPIKFKIDSEQMAADIQAAVNQITDIEINLRVNTDSLRSSVEGAVNNGGSNVPTVDTSGMSELQNILNGLNNAGVQGQSVFQSFGNTLKEVGATFTVFNFLTDAIYKVGDAARDAVSTVKELDDSIVALQLATGKSYNTVSNMMNDYIDLGAELGTVGTAVAEGADAWLRQGKSIEEVNNLVKSSVIFSKVGDMSAEDATKYLTASLNGYQLEAENAMSVVDKISNVDLNAAVSSSGLAEAMSRVAVTADQAGISMDRLLGYVATIGEVTQQSMSTVGTAMKSILTRMTNIKAGKLELVDEDGTTEKLSDVEATLANVGINLRKTMTEYNSASDVLDALASKWDTLNQAQQNAIAISFSGQRMQNQFRVLMENYDRVQKYTDVAANSEGSGEQKFDLYLQGLEAKTNSLKASLESLSSSVISRDLYAGFLDGSKAVVDFTEKTGLLKGALAGLGTAGATYALSQLVSMATSATKEFSNLSNALKMVKAAESAGTFDTSNMASLINLTKGLSESQTKLVLSSTALSDAQRVAVLMGQGMTEAQASAAVASMGLASAEEVATGATVSLSSALSGLMSTLLANPMILIAAGVTAVVSAFSAYKRSIEEAVDKAQEAGNAWEDNNTSLQDNIDKITELRTALDNGTLTEEEAYQAKSDLLEIQDSLTESYGNQAQGIDLVNGSLDQQISKLKELSTEESKRFLNENKKGVEEAEKQMEKERHAYLGQYSDNGSDESNAINQAITKLKNKYGDDVFNLQEGMEGTGNFEIEFTADASTAKDALNDFMNEIRSIQEQYGESDVLTSLSNYASGGLEEANDILTEYQDLYNQAKQAELFSGKQQYSGKTALEWLNKYEDAVNKYNDAISGGNADEIADAKQYYDDINKSVQVLMNTDASKYSSQFKEIGDQLNTAAIKANEFNQALSGEGENGFQKHLQSVAEEIKKLNMDDADFKAAVASGDVDSINYLVEAAKNAGIITGKSASEIQPLITALGNLGYISNMSADGLDNVADSASNVDMSFSDLAKEDSSSLLQEISAVQEVLDSQSIGMSVSYDDFNSDALAEYRDCLEYVNGSLVLNEENVKNLTKAKVEEQVATNNTAKAQKQQEYLENAKQIEALRQKLLDNTDATGKSAESIQEQIDGLLASNDAIVEQCSQLDLLNSSLMESIGIYQQWKDAQNASESGNMFDDAITASKQIDDVLNNTDSDIYGRVGRKDYQASLDFLIPDTVDSTDENAINSYLSSIDNLFTHNEDGERAGLNIEEFCKNAMDKGLMVLDEAGENYQVAGGKTMEDFAEGMNLSMPMVQAMFGEMQEFGANFDWSDEGIQTMGDIAVAATEASEALRGVAGNEDLKINLDVSNLETTEEKCSALDDTISEMNAVKAKVGVDSSEVDQANTIIQYCVAQKQQLEAPAVMNVDVSQVSGKIGEAVGLLQEFQTAQNTLQMQETLGMDTSEAQANVKAVADKIKGLDTNVKATLSIDDSSIDTIQDSISSKLTNEVMVKAGIDDSAIIGFQETKHDAKGEVDWDNDTTKVDAYAAAEKNSKGTVLWSNDETLVKKEFTAVGHINWGNTSAPTSGKGSVNGTAHVSSTAKVSGNAKASGDWGNKHPGKTLVGELGRELWVDIRTGKWETIGNNGAEFRDIPQGAIVFNHVQTEELLSNGFTASRAVALASGTSPDISGKALVSGNAMVTGGISVKQAQKSVVSGGNTAKTANATNADTKATKNHTKATNDSTKATKKSKKTFDWVANKLKEWEKKVKKISDQITDYITSALKTSLMKKQMKTMNKEISSNNKGEIAYMKKANSVAKKYTYYDSDGGEINVSIPKKYQKLVQSGAYRVEDMDTSTDQGKALAEAISEYQNWYEKAQDCKQAVIDLRNEQQKLFEQWANMPTEKAEKKIDRLTTGYNGINAVSSRLTAATKGGSTQAVLAQTMKEDLAEAQDQKKSDNKALKSAKTANKKAYSAKKKADNKVKSTAKSLLKTNLTDEQKKQVKSGKKIDSTGMSGSQKKKADAYNKAVTNKSKANKKATSAKSKLSTAKSNYNSSNSTYKSMKSNVNTALNAYDSGDSLSYMNGLVDEQVSGKKAEQEARKTAVEQANANLTTTKKQKTTANKKLAKLQKKYKNSKNLTAAQKKKIVAGKEIDTTGITNAKQLKILTAYNNALADSKKKKENVTIATNALAEANENLMTAEVESAQATVEAVSTKFDNAKTYYEALLSYQEQLSKYQEKNIDLAKSHGDYEKSSDYDTKISNTQAERAIKQNELDELTKQLNDGVEAGTIVENSQEWLDMQTKIKEAQNAVADYDTQIEELKQSQIGVYYEEQFERAAEKVDRFRDKLDGLKSLISDDMKIDKNTGLLTESGALSITLDVDDINASTENLKTYIKERQQIINDYNAGKFGEDEYNQKLKDVDENIKSTTANIYSSRNSILELVKSQSQAELDVLNKVIDKRKEALSAKKNYYDYDKTLKNKTKDIEVLERQIAALEGSTSAEDKARKAKLQEQLDSAKEDLNDTITDHAYSMQTDALDKLSTDMSEDLDKWINTISSNMEEMTTAINDAVKNAGLSTAGTINAISSILRHYGLSDSEISQSGLTNITGYASGTDYVPKSGIYRVNENGMESVFSKQYGTLTFLNQGDKVFDANFTKSLLDNATIATQKNMPDYAGMAKAIEKNIQNIQNLSGNTYVNNFYIDGAQDTDSILKEIDKHLDKKIQAHDKKQVRDFKSLR